MLGAFVLIGLFALLGVVPRWTALGLAALPLAIRPMRVVGSTESGPELIGALRATARLHFVVGALVAVGAAL